MFDNLTQRLSHTLKNLTGRGSLSEENIKDSLKEVRNALLDADVALSVVDDFSNHIKNKALGTEVLGSVRPGQAFIKIVQDELTHIMGDENFALNLQAQAPIVILMVGLQGSGKTTTAAKLANFLQNNHKKSVVMASADIYRPAAIDQLQTLANSISTHYFPSDISQKPIDIAKGALDFAKKHLIDVLILDTAGRLHIDEEMMNELKQLHKAMNPTETLLVVDSMMGQDAAKTVKAFHETVDLTGVILSKADGDSRGGAALSVRHITGKPIKFLGVGEKIDGLEAFHPNRVASRILGMGDIVSLVEEAHRKVDEKHAEKMAKKLKKGKKFDLEDFSMQLKQMRSMGGIGSLLSKMPGAAQLPQNVPGMLDDKKTIMMEAIINSMTKKERRNPQMIKGSHKRRIANGSGTNIQDINRLLKQFSQMQKMMDKLKGGGMEKMMRKFQGMGGGGFDGLL